MPLTDEQAAALGVLATADPEEVATEVKTKANPLWTLIFNAGHQKATAATSKDVTRAEKERDAALEKARLAEEAADKARKGNPDIEQVRNETKAERDRIEREAKEKEMALLGQVERLKKQRIIDRFETMLVDPEVGAVRKGWAKMILRDPDLMDRIELGKEEGEFEILQPGKKIPIQAEDDTPDGKLKALAKEHRTRLEKEDPEGIAVRVDDGSGVRTTQDTGGPEGGYDPVKAGKERAKQQTGAAADDSLAWR